jgi:hypothetical protein
MFLIEPTVKPGVPALPHGSPAMYILTWFRMGRHTPSDGVSLGNAAAYTGSRRKGGMVQFGLLPRNNTVGCVRDAPGNGAPRTHPAPSGLSHGIESCRKRAGSVLCRLARKPTTPPMRRELPKLPDIEFSINRIWRCSESGANSARATCTSGDRCRASTSSNSPKKRWLVWTVFGRWSTKSRWFGEVGASTGCKPD